LKSLVVYYSRTGNAKFVAETIAKEPGSNIRQLLTGAERSNNKSHGNAAVTYFERNFSESIILRAESTTAKTTRKTKSNIRLVIPEAPSSVCLAASLA